MGEKFTARPRHRQWCRGRAVVIERAPRCARYSAFQTGFRFSRNARMPSLASLLERTWRLNSTISSCHASLELPTERRMLIFMVRSDSGALAATFSAQATAASSS